MKVLHLCMDHNFVVDSRKKFEEYYPGQNIFILHKVIDQFRIVKDTTGFKIYNLQDEGDQDKVAELCSSEHVDKIVLHGMVPYMAKLLPKIKAVKDVKVYWLFWGYELYESIAYNKGYKLIDGHFNPFNPSSYYKPFFITKWIRKVLGKSRADDYERIMTMVDYFCFWNYKDFQLLKHYYPLPMEFRFFAYSATGKTAQPPFLFDLENRAAKRILINHQATAFGNHIPVLRKLAEIDKNNLFEKVVPLSYGFNIIRNEVLRKGKKYFGEKFVPILDYMTQNEYFEMLQTIDIAIFGQHRQEASGNIIQLLRNGVKVFLRNDNNLLSYYREKGYVIFSYEDDLNDISALTSLTLEQKNHNRDIALRHQLRYDDFMPSLLD
ncbi:MAG: TDP-N-acetylfucosamine:lipid II N-acetylfucosaminyltransferase [Muribaculaceae bacterium]|nr:TDP-N-acetylfucosamine:lipid II N-acetylfucosaminyltransferase [Muribaculaceae bacterium]